MLFIHRPIRLACVCLLKYRLWHTAVPVRIPTHRLLLISKYIFAWPCLCGVALGESPAFGQREQTESPLSEFIKSTGGAKPRVSFPKISVRPADIEYHSTPESHAPPRPPLPPTHPGHIQSSDFRKIVIIPDVHGDQAALIESLFVGMKKVETEPSRITLEKFSEKFESAIAILLARERAPRSETATKLLPFISNDRKVALIQLGDLMDRGPSSLECIRIIAAVHDMLGWRVVSLYGNHEIMNMAGTAHPNGYISSDDLGGFTNKETRIAGVQPGGRFFPRMTRSFVAMARLAGPDRGSSTLFVHGGVDMKWLERRIPGHVRGSALVKLVNTAFTNSVFSKKDLDDLEDTELRRITEEYVRSHSRHPTRSEQVDALMMKIEKTFAGHYGNNPVWSRSLAEPTIAEGFIGCGRDLDALLALFEVDRIIVGHTPQYDRLIKHRCGGKIILADIAMSQWVEGDHRQPAAFIMDTQLPQNMKLLPFEPFTYDKVGSSNSIRKLAFQKREY